MSTQESINALRERIARLPARRRAPYLVELRTALATDEADVRDAALHRLSRRVLRAEALDRRPVMTRA